MNPASDRGLAEKDFRADAAGAAIVEHPGMLEARIFGRSRRRVVHHLTGHLGLLAELAWRRVRGEPTRMSIDLRPRWRTPMTSPLQSRNRR